MHVGFVVRDAVEHRQVLLERDQPLPVHRRPELPERFIDAEAVVLGGALEVDAVLRRFRHALEPVEQLLRGEVLRVVELLLGFLRRRPPTGRSSCP